MLATSALNKGDFPIYGTFVQGRLWFFLTYHNLEFAETSSYDMLKIDDLLKVVKILKKQKAIILQRLET